VAEARDTTCGPDSIAATDPLLMNMRAFLSAFLFTLVALTVPVRAQDTPHGLTLREWIQAPRILSMRLSPDGKTVAAIAGGSAPVAFVMDVDHAQTKVIARWQADGRHVYGRWPTAVNWINNELLALDFSDRESISVDVSGKKIATLGERFIRPMIEKGNVTDSVLVYRDVDDGEIDVVNARTGARAEYRIALPGKLIYWAFDASGALRAVTMMDTAFWSEKTRVSNWYRPDERSKWQLLEEGPVTADYWRPLRVLPESNSLAIISRRDRDTYAVFRYDTVERRSMEMMAGHPYEDIWAVKGLDDGKFESVITGGIKPQISWFDERWAGLQAGVDAALPGRINVMRGNKNGRLLIRSYGDVDPGRWYVLDTETSKMWQVGEVMPQIDPAQMRPMETIRYLARDGMVVNAYLTRPVGAAGAPAPMVVLIHGGPQVRDDWEWNEEVQLLASKGYTVFQPQFRGSTGFGRKFEEAGYRQWGRAMQDDITDGVMYLVAQKIADPARICIYGASYGGYAALWGVIKTPELYKCGVSFAGISDLASYVSHSILDDSDAVARELHRKRIGDPEQDRARLDEVSPLKHAAQVRVPLLIAHGEEDTRVLPRHGKEMVKALQDLGKPVEWMSFEREGHGLFFSMDKYRYYSALLAFFKRHIGDADPTAAVSAAATDARPDGLAGVRRPRQ
jgi:dipeptidyl aminopeptidase/acylaminoacyl peptidase